MIYSALIDKALFIRQPTNNSPESNERNTTKKKKKKKRTSKENGKVEEK